MIKTIIYPPSELKRKISRGKVIDGWEELSNKMAQPEYSDHKLGIFMHIFF